MFFSGYMQISPVFSVFWSRYDLFTCCQYRQNFFWSKSEKAIWTAPFYNNGNRFSPEFSQGPCSVIRYFSTDVPALIDVRKARTKAMNSFTEVLNLVKESIAKSGEISATAYNLWIKPLEPISFKDNVASLSLQSVFQRNITSNYLPRIERAFEEVLGFPVTVQILVA